MAEKSKKKLGTKESGTSGGDQTQPNPQVTGAGGGGEGRPTPEGDRSLDALNQRKADKEKDDLVKYMSNGNKTKLMTSGLLNTAALSTNASLFALILKLEQINATASISMILVIVSVTLQLMTAIFTLLEYRATLIIDRDPEKLWQRRTLKKPGSDTNGNSRTNPNGTDVTSSYTFCKPMELQFLGALCTVILTAVNTFTIALTSNIREDLEIPAIMLARTVNYQNNV